MFKHRTYFENKTLRNFKPQMVLSRKRNGFKQKHAYHEKQH